MHATNSPGFAAAILPAGATDPAAIELSIVATLYRSQAHLLQFYERVKAAATDLSDRHEIVLVNDGSPDNSLRIALELVKRDPTVRVVDLSRNFGHHRAMMTGLAHARGDLVFLIDSDLEEDPAVLGRFAIELERSRADVVYGMQQARKGRFFERVGGAVCYRIFNALSKPPIPANVCTVRPMTRRLLGGLTQTYHADPCRVLDLAYRFSNRVILRNDYMPFEFTVFVDLRKAFDPSVNLYPEFADRA